MMKRLLSIILFCAACTGLYAQTQMTLRPDLQTVDDGFFDPTKKVERVREPYHFKMDYRIEAGYLQSDQRVPRDSSRYCFLHGARLGATVNFHLPLHFSLETGLSFSLQAGTYQQHYRSMEAESAQAEYITHSPLSFQMAVPVRLYYTIPLWRKLNLFFYTGPQLQIGLLQQDRMDCHLSQGTYNWMQQNGLRTESYDRYREGELHRVSIQWGLGGGLEWDCYRLKAGYDFGLNQLYRNPISTSQRMWEWQWGVSFCYRIPNGD